MAKKKSKKRKVIQKNIRLTPEKYIKRHARKLPIVKTLVTDSILENGIGHVIVIRQKKNEELILGMYLIDTWCLGLKDTIYKISNKWEIEEIIQFYTEDIITEEVDQSYAFNLIYGSIEFAEDNGFEPHKAFSITEYILPPVESIDYIDIEFGVNGIPHYEIDPDDNVKKILKTLEKTRGKENFTIYIDNEFKGELPDDLANILDQDIEQEIKDSPFYRKSNAIIEVILNIYKNNYNKLKSDYTKNPKELNSRILENIRSNESFYAFPLEEFSSLIYPTIENLLIYEKEDYLFEEVNMYSFIEAFDHNDDQIINSILNISLVQYGSLKLEILFNLILKLCYIDDITIAQAFLEDLLDNFSIGNIDFIQESNHIILKDELELALFLIDQHKTKVGPINFNEIKLTAIESF